ncbi:MAG: transposase [Rickettsiaceae bacterium]|nr:transposase [Rickettsiaceae bacterium]
MLDKVLDLYTDYLISQNKHATSTGLSEIVDGEISHDKITRFLNSNNFGSRELWQYVKQTVKKHQSKDNVLTLDDSIEEKPNTDENEIICWHYSHAKGTHVKGINILSCTISNEQITLPVGYEIVRKDKEYYDEEEQKYKRRASISKNERFRELITNAIKNGIIFKYILADNWFCAKDNINYIHHDLNKKFILGLKSNRLISLNNIDRKNKRYTKIKELQKSDGDIKKVWLKDVNFPILLCKKVFINENGRKGELYLISNDLDLNSRELYKVYQKRWRIEEYHKSIKQNTSLAKSPTKVEKSQRNHIFCSLVAFCKLEMLKVKTNLNHFAIKYKLILKANLTSLQELRNIASQYHTA